VRVSGSSRQPGSTGNHLVSSARRLLLEAAYPL
jgi:hypothetical protein